MTPLEAVGGFLCFIAVVIILQRIIGKGRGD